MTVIALFLAVVAFFAVFGVVAMVTLAAHWLSIQIAKSLEKLIEADDTAM